MHQEICIHAYTLERISSQISRLSRNGMGMGDFRGGEEDKDGTDSSVGDGQD